jgi:hypothetical protein
MLWGTLKTKTTNLTEILTIYLVDVPYKDLNSVYFYDKSVEVLLEEAARMKKPRLGKNKDFGWTFLGKGNLTFTSVNYPLKLIEVLSSILPLKPHPSLKNVYQRSTQ